MILVIETAASTAVVALAAPDGSLVAWDAWDAGHRHVEELVPRLDALLRAAQVAPASLQAVAVGTGPGGFTGLRVGIATAKALTDALGILLVALPSGTLLLQAARTLDAEAEALLLPAGLADRVLLDAEGARIIRGRDLPDAEAGRRIVAIDLEGRASEEALELGHRALLALPSLLASAAAARVRTGAFDDPSTVVPEYVTLPRGVEGAAGDAEVDVHLSSGVA